LPQGCVFDGEIVALDETGRPMFNDLLFGRREPTYIIFDLLFIEGADVRSAPLKERKALLEIVRRYRQRLACEGDWVPPKLCRKTESPAGF
jgi:ATP-dependent DNA ligase